MSGACHSGIVAKAPASTTARLRVVIPSFDPEQGEDLRWMPRGTTLPAAGDECLVITTAEGDAWVAAWWPS